LALINAPPGNCDAGERGIASLVREDDCKRSFAAALEYAVALGNVRMHVMAGIIWPYEDRACARAVYWNNLEYVTQQAASAGIIVVIEPINTRDIPGYLLNRQDEAHSVCADVGALNLKVEMDFYHCQIVEGDLAVKLRKYIGGIGHTHIAGVPARHTPDDGKINYPYLFGPISTTRFDGAKLRTKYPVPEVLVSLFLCTFRG
jgi:hydroxypyruvate isomerase